MHATLKEIVHALPDYTNIQQDITTAYYDAVNRAKAAYTNVLHKRVVDHEDDTHSDIHEVYTERHKARALFEKSIQTAVTRMHDAIETIHDAIHTMHGLPANPKEYHILLALIDLKEEIDEANTHYEEVRKRIALHKYYNAYKVPLLQFFKSYQRITTNVTALSHTVPRERGI